MKCPKCNITMEPGACLVSHPAVAEGSEPGDGNTVTLVQAPSNGQLNPCLKCPQCGHSVSVPGTFRPCDCVVKLSRGLRESFGPEASLELNLVRVGNIIRSELPGIAFTSLVKGRKKKGVIFNTFCPSCGIRLRAD